MAFRGAALIVCALAIWHATSGEDCRDRRFIPAEKDELLSVNCTVPGAQRLSWELHLYGPNGSIGSCQLSGESACQITGGDRYALTRQGPHTSTLTIAPPTQLLWQLRVDCTGTKLEHGTETELEEQYCIVLPMYPADKFKNCSLQWNPTDWTVSGFCEVDNLNRPHWRRTLWRHVTSAGQDVIRFSSLKRLGNHKVRGEFHGFEMNTAHRSGHFDLIMLAPGRSVLFVAKIPVEKPGDPELDNCPSYVTEGSNLTCRCRPSSSKPGTPRPVVTWTPKQAGDNQLHISNIQRESDNQTFTCYQYWGGWNDSDVRTVSYTVHLDDSEGYTDASSAVSTTPDDEYAETHPRPTTQSAADEKDDYQTVLVIACGLEGGVIVLLVVVIVIITRRRRGSEGNTAPRTVGAQRAADHQMPRSADDHQMPRSANDHQVPRSANDHQVPRSADDHQVPRTSGDHQVPRERRLPSQDSEGYTDARSAAPATTDEEEHLELLARRPPSADVYQGLQTDVAGQRSVYAQFRPGNRRRPNE